MKFSDLVFEDVGCCQTHKQAKVERANDHLFVTVVADDLYSVAIHAKDGGLLSRHNLLSSQQVEELL